jgi:hypothetical protein
MLLKGLKFKNGSKVKFFAYKQYSIAMLFFTKLLFKNYFEKYKDINVVFIVSTGRTGTHFFSHFFSRFLNKVVSLHEPKPDLFYVSTNFLRGKISRELAKWMIINSRKRYLSKVEKDGVYIESNNNLAYLLNLLEELFDSIKIVHVERNGIDVVRSYYSWEVRGKWVGKTCFLSHNDPRDRISPNWFPENEFYNKYQDMTRFERVCWYWSTKNRLIKYLIDKSENGTTFKFESLFVDKDEEEWKRLFTFIKNSPVSSYKEILDYVKIASSNKSRNKKIAGWEDWSVSQKKSFQLIAGDHMIECGYFK